MTTKTEMPTPTVKIDDAKMLRKMKQYEKSVGKEVKQLVHNAGRLCCLELAKSTAPKGAGVAAKKQGEKKITKNIRGIFTIVNQKWWKEVTSGRAFRSGGAALHDKSGKVWALDSQDTIASVDAAKSFHKSQRGSDGQAKRLGMLDRAIVRQAVYRKFLKETLARVGISKAGWGIAAAACKADARQPVRGIPAWVRRNMGRAKGSINDRRAAGFSWQIKLRNKVRYARETLSTNGQSFAVNLARRKFFSMMNHAIRAQKAKEAGLKQ
jgi:hypothetical protein